jgi:hypothetical protein
LNGEEKTNFPLPKELSSNTLTKIVAQLRKIYKKKLKIQLKLKRRKIQRKFNGLIWNLEIWISLLMSGNEFATTNFIQIKKPLFSK